MLREGLEWLTENGSERLRREAHWRISKLGADEGDDYLVCEIGTNAPGEVTQLAAIDKLSSFAQVYGLVAAGCLLGIGASIKHVGSIAGAIAAKASK